MFTDQSIAPKRLVKFSGILLMLIYVSTIISCGSKHSSGTGAGPQTLTAEWPTYKLPKQKLQEFFKEDGTLIGPKKLIFATSIDDYNEPCTSMNAYVAAAVDHNDYARGKVSEMLEIDKTATTKAVSGLIQGNSEIFLDDLHNKIFKAGTWIPDFEYLRLTPQQHNRFKGYLSFKYEACDKNGKVLAWAVIMATSDDFCNPTPPGRPSAE